MWAPPTSPSMGTFCPCDSPDLGLPLDKSCGGGNFLVFMALLDTLVRKQCDLLDPCDRVRPTRQPSNDYDFIVVGGGSGGAVVAGRLAEVPNWKVLLIEAGGDEPPGQEVPAMIVNYWFDPSTSWNYYSDPQERACLGSENHKCLWPRGKMLGGCGSINGMMYMRGNKRDYDNWKAMGNEGWGWDDVLPYFKKLEDNKQIGSVAEAELHGVNGPVTIEQFPHQPDLISDMLKAAKDQGFPISKNLNGKQNTGFAVAQATQRNGTRLTSARAYLRPHWKKPNLHVMLNSTVTKVLINPTTKQAMGVEVIYNNKKYEIQAAKEVILSAGTLNTPHLLLLSGVGPKEDLQKVGVPVVHDLPGVGKNFHNHVAYGLKYKLKKLPKKNHLNWKTASEYLSDRTGPLSSSGMSQMTAILNSQFSTPDYPDIQLFFLGMDSGCGNGDITPDDNSPEELEIDTVNLHPKSRGFIKLRSANPMEAPSMDPKYLMEDDDIKILIEGIRKVQQLVNSTHLKQKYDITFDDSPVSDCDKHGKNTDAYWECRICYDTGAENHQAGSCKMGPSSDPLAVVDPGLTVHGIDRLRIMDASVMPKLPSSNTQGPTFMIAEKGADFIKQRWARSIDTTVNLGSRFGAEDRPPFNHPPFNHHHWGPPPGHWGPPPKWPSKPTERWGSQVPARSDVKG